MNKKSTKSIGLLILAASLLASCGGKKIESSSGAIDTSDTTSETDDTEYVAPDKSNLKYISSIDKYKKTDWKASWIWDEKQIQNSYVAFRKNFQLSDVPAKATAHISAVSKYYMWVNGTLAVYDGCPKQTATAVDSYYEDVDLTSYLKKGDNTIVIMVTYVGRSSNSYIDCGAPGLLFELEAGSTSVISDNTWKVKRLKEYRNKSLLKDEWPEHPASSFIAEWDVYYDARESSGDFMSPTFDDSSWSNSVTVGKVGYLPYGDTYISDMPLIKFKKEITEAGDLDNVIGKKFTEARTVKFDLGENRQFSPYFELEAEAGAHLVYYTDTYETDSGKQFNFKDDYVAKAGAQTFESMPWRTGSKLFIDVPAGVTLTKVGFRENGYATERTGKFVSDNASANQLWNESRNTVQICMRDTYMDCPDRERSPYAGDSANQFPFTYYGFDTNATTLIKKTLRTLPGWVKNDGIIPSRWPSNNTNEITIQNLAMVAAFDDYYLYTGDTESLELVYPIALNYLKLWKMESNGLPEKRLGTFKWIDWGTGADSAPLYDEFYYLACEKMLHLANSLGHSEDASFYQDRMNSIKSSFQNAYKKEKGYASSDREPDERIQAMGIITGLIPETDWEWVTPIMEKTLTASTYMERYILEALCVEGRFDLAKERMLTRYEPMLNDDMTTLWEFFTDTGSRNHGWSGAPLLMLSKHVAGIRPTGGNYSSYELAPHDTFGNLETNTSTEKGDISMKVETSAGVTTITVDTIQADGTLKIDSAYGSDITVKAGTSELKETKENYKAYSLTNGHYVFEVK